MAVARIRDSDKAAADQNLVPDAQFSRGHVHRHPAVRDPHPIAVRFGVAGDRWRRGRLAGDGARGLHRRQRRRGEVA
ncbi:hypothetical protein [Streptomyces sp. NPDC059919]|uniref:hypothetical protein n=1 Tax=Streptomyces sp. NPDC059919 TaxID=3347004 RepID=UPI003646A4FB